MNMGKNPKKSLTLTGPFIKIEATETNDSMRGVVRSVTAKNHQLSLIAAFLFVNHRKGGDRFFKEGGFFSISFVFLFCKVLSHRLREVKETIRVV
jgi:hypothetical protein